MQAPLTQVMGQGGARPPRSLLAVVAAWRGLGLAALLGWWLAGGGVPEPAGGWLGLAGTLAVALGAAVLRLRREAPLPPWLFFCHTLADAGLLLWGFAMSGGASSPFTFLFLVPLAMTALALGWGVTLAMAVITVGAYGGLLTVDFPHHHGHDFAGHLRGMWAGYGISAFLLVGAVQWMRTLLLRRERELEALREEGLRERQLVHLGLLAAGAAHELSTPLNTMALLVEELDETSPVAAQLRRQIHRCRESLKGLLQKAGAPAAGTTAAQNLARYAGAVVEEARQLRPGTTFTLAVDPTGTPPPVVVEPMLTQALHNLLNNAADVSPEVAVTVRWESRWCTFAIADRGPGLPPLQSEGGGLGIGLALTATVVKSLGGALTSAARDGGGTVMTVRLPLVDAVREAASLG